MKAIAKVSVVQQVEEEIRKYILSDSVAVGQKLPSEKVFCEELNIGRGSVREALRLLQARGYVEIVQGKGAFVASKEEMNRDELAGWFQKNEVQLKDFIEVRMAIEPLAVRLAVERCDEEGFRKLELIMARTLLAAESGDYAELAICDEKFHTGIIEYSRNELLIQINKEITKRLKQFRQKTFRIDTNIRNCIPFHQGILDAMRRKDVEEAQKVLLRHLECVGEDLEASKKQ